MKILTRQMILGAFLVPALTLFSCGKKRSDPVESTNVDLSLIGDWQTSCADSDWNGATSRQDFFSFYVDGTFRRDVQFFSGSNCVDSLGTFTTKGDRVIGLKLSDSSNVRGLNLIVKEMSAKPTSDSLVQALNAVNYCGVNNWANDQSVDLLTRDCAGESAEKDQIVYQVYETDGQHLYFGSSTLWLDAGGDASLRPEDVDKSVEFSLNKRL